ASGGLTPEVSEAMATSPVAQLPMLARPEERDRLLRRMEHNARARERTAKINGELSSVRQENKQTFLREAAGFRKDIVDSAHERTARWTTKTQDHPFLVDLWAEDE
ncbi:unnamed protein product, partial [Polarella glacialis]